MKKFYALFVEKKLILDHPISRMVMTLMIFTVVKNVDTKQRPGIPAKNIKERE